MHRHSYEPIVPGLALSEQDTNPDKYASNVDVEILRYCNFNCKYCYLDRNSISHSDPPKRRLLHVIDEIAGIGPHNVLFTGGEPLLREDLPSLLHYAVNEKGLSVSTFTNGFFMTKENAELLARYDVRVCVKMDTVDPVVQDELTGIVGSATAIRKAIRNLKNEGYGTDLPLAIHACITRLNYKRIDELYGWARSEKITPSCSRLVPWGMARMNYAHLGLSAEEFRDTFMGLGAEGRIPFPNRLGCIKMYKSCFINSFGDVQPCSNVLVPAGNIYKTELKEILRGTVFSVARNIRGHLKGKCRTCENNTICYGCRGLTHSLTGDWLGEDPLCWCVVRERRNGELLDSVSTKLDSNLGC